MFKNSLNSQHIFASLKAISSHGIAQFLALFGSVIRIPLILAAISQLEFAAILMSLQFLGMSGLIFGSLRLFARKPPKRFQIANSETNVKKLCSEILNYSGWLFLFGFIISLIFLLIFRPKGASDFFFAFSLLITSILIFGFSAYFGVLAGILDSRNKYNELALSDMLSTILMVILTIVAVKIRVNLAIYLIIGSLTLFNMGIYSTFKLRNEKIFHRIRFGLNINRFKEFFNFMGQGIGAFLSNNFDLLILGKLGNQIDVVQYSATQKMNLAVDLPSASNSPRQWREICNVSKKDSQYMRKVWILNLRFVVVNLFLTIPIASTLFFLYKPYMIYTLGNDYQINYSLFWILVLSRLMYTTYSTLYLSLSLNSRLKLFTKIGVSIGILNIGISCLAVLYFPILGPAIGTILASAFGILLIFYKNFVDIMDENRSKLRVD